LSRRTAWSITVNALLYRCIFCCSPTPATTELYTLSLHDALPIFQRSHDRRHVEQRVVAVHVAKTIHAVELDTFGAGLHFRVRGRSEEHTSELQSRENLVCRLLLEKKNP